MHAGDDTFRNSKRCIAPLESTLFRSPFKNPRLVREHSANRILAPSPHLGDFADRVVLLNFRMQDLIDRQMLTRDQAEQLIAAVRRADNILLAGGTGAGKTSLLNVLADFIPEQERILIIEDTAELHIRKPHVVSTEAQLDTHKIAITFDDLLRSVLRHRPDRILVGEVRGKEARTLLDAMNTGHRGTLATIHANSAEEALRNCAAGRCSFR